MPGSVGSFKSKGLVLPPTCEYITQRGTGSVQGGTVCCLVLWEGSLMNNQDKNNQVGALYSGRGCCGEPLCWEGRLQPARGSQGAASKILAQHVKSRVMLLFCLKKINI